MILNGTLLPLTGHTFHKHRKMILKASGRVAPQG